MPRRRKTRAGNGDGSVWLHKGRRRWVAEIAFSVGGGKMRSLTRWCRTRGEALEALQELRQQTLRPVKSGRHTLAEFLQSYLRWVKDNRAANTHESYRMALEKWIIPEIGRVELQQLTAIHVQFALEKIPKKQSRTRENAFTVLRTALNSAVRQRLIDVSPCSQMQAPRHRSEKVDPFTVSEMQSILEEVKLDRLQALYVLAFSTGLRFGELAGLQWSDIDFRTQQVSIRRQVTHCRGKLQECPPKTETSVRTIRLADEVCEALEGRRRTSVAEGFAAEPWVFLGQRGRWLSGSNFRQKQWLPLLSHLEIPAHRFHDARHTFATIALAAGVEVHVVSRILGHSKPSVTLDIYAHLMDFHQESAIEKQRAFLAS